MAILEHELRSIQSNLTGFRRRLFTLEEYLAFRESVLLGDDRLELLEGEMIEMAPIGDPHAALTDGLADILRNLFGQGYYVRIQAPILLVGDPKPSVPQPDIVVAKGSWRDYLHRKPEPADIVLLVEIADSSLSGDRGVKASLYAAAGIPEYWIVNLAEAQLEVNRVPLAAGYSACTILHAGQTIAPLACAPSLIVVSDFLI